MRRQPVLDQDDLLAADKSLQLLEKLDQALAVEAVRFRSRQQARLFTVPAESQRRRYGCLAPVVAPHSQDRSLPPRRPRPADGGLLREAGFVLEEDPGLLASSVFFSSGQRTVFQ